MITIHKLSDLEQFGIRALTGEACRVGTRILCDLTPKGREIVCDLFGIRQDPHTFRDSYNHNGATASFMLPYALTDDLAVWCLIHRGCTQVIRSDDGVYGREEGDSDIEWEELYGHLSHFKHRPRRIRVNTNQPGEGTRATHAVSGRTE